MNSHPHSSLAPEQASNPQPTCQVGGAEKYRRIIDEMVDIGANLLRMVHREAQQAEAASLAAADASPAFGTARPAKSAADLAGAYDVIFRSIRRAILLDEKLAAPKKTLSIPHRIAARKKIIRDVEDAIESYAPPGEEEKLHAEFLERLDGPDLEDEIADRAIADIVTDINRDLGVSGLYDGHPWKRRIPHDIAILNARAEQVSGAAPTEKLAALLASAPPRPPPSPRTAPLTAADVAKMSDEEIETRLERLSRYRDP